MSVIVGVSGVKRNAAVAVVRDGAVAAVCEQGRVTRVGNIGIASGGFPQAALEVALETAGVTAADVSEFVTGEDRVDVGGPPLELVEHHRAHAATAFLTSPFPEALVLVCDTSTDREVSAWHGSGTRLEEIRLGWDGPGFATVYSRLTQLLRFRAGSDEYLVEALARLGLPTDGDPALELLESAGGGLRLSTGFDEYVQRSSVDAGHQAAAAAAGAIQYRLGRLLVECLSDLARRVDVPAVCLGGGLFFNTYLNTVVRESGLFRDVFVPINPGNAGVAVGAALARAAEVEESAGGATLTSPFLGPAFTSEQIKSVLDNCKLSYDFLEASALERLVVEALLRGELIGWFTGGMEWGTRALGNRSIFANPLAPYVLENLNRFLKQREAYRTYGLAVPVEDVEKFLEGPASSPYMENQDVVRDPGRLAPVCPSGSNRLRVQTVAKDQPTLRRLLGAFGASTGVPMLVNTSFNGFHEPIVSSPRDAVRVFYGSGLDMLVIENFVLRK